jgi:hypothetical protein
MIALHFLSDPTAPQDASCIEQMSVEYQVD